jgi:hypothetical protein
VGVVMSKASVSETKPMPNAFEIKAKNRGRTPASIISASQDFLVITQRAKIPEIPVYKQVDFKEGEIVFPDESRAIVSFNRDIFRLKCLDTGDLEKVWTGEAYVIVFGNVIYRDLLSTPEESIHETRWCAKFEFGEDGDSFVLTRGRDGYRLHT